MNRYLIPANSKKSLLIFGMFNSTDLWILVPGLGVTLILLMVLPVSNLIPALIAIAPGIVCSFLVLPIPNYHNVRTFIKVAYRFFSMKIRGEQELKWKGWCVLDDNEKE